MPKFRVLAAVAGLAMTVACGSSTGPKQTEINTAPTVQIGQSQQIGGRVPAVQSVSVQYQDTDTLAGNRPSSITFVLDGVVVENRSLTSAAGLESYITEELPEGTYTLEAKVCDAGGLCGQDATTFDIRAAHYIATLRVFDGIEFLPGAGAQLCLDDICELADSEGIARLENIGTAPRGVSVQGDFHPNAMAGLATRRTDYNFFNLTPEMARTGHVPKDEQIELGENERTILLFTEDFPFEEYANRWWLPSRDDQYQIYLPPRTPHRVNWVVGAFELSIRRGGNSPVTEEELSQLLDDMNGMMAFVMDSVYARIGFPDPVTYVMQEAAFNPAYWEGVIRFTPDRGSYDFRKTWGEGTGMDSRDYILSLTNGFRLNLDTSTSFTIARWQTRMSMFEYFCGIHRYDAAEAGGLTSPFLLGMEPEELVLDPTEEELAMCVMGTAFGPRAIMRDSTTLAIPVHGK